MSNETNANVVTNPTVEQPTKDETTTIRESRDSEFQARIKAEQEVAALKKQLEAQQQVAQEKKSSDKDALLKSWQEKCSKLESEIKKRDQHVLQSRLDSLVTEYASKINPEVPELFKPMIEKRIRATLNDSGQLSVHCLDANGNPTAQTPDEVIKEILANKKYSKYIVANQASGSSSESSNAIPFPAPQGKPSVVDGNVDLSTAHPDTLEQIVKQRYIRKGA